MTAKVNLEATIAHASGGGNTVNTVVTIRDTFSCSCSKGWVLAHVSPVALGGSAPLAQRQSLSALILARTWWVVVGE
jgi:hypothetical protein